MFVEATRVVTREIQMEAVMMLVDEELRTIGPVWYDPFRPTTSLPLVPKPHDKRVAGDTTLNAANAPGDHTASLADNKAEPALQSQSGPSMRTVDDHSLLGSSTSTDISDCARRALGMLPTRRYAAARRKVPSPLSPTGAVIDSDSDARPARTIAEPTRATPCPPPVLRSDVDPREDGTCDIQSEAGSLAAVGRTLASICKALDLACEGRGVGGIPGQPRVGPLGRSVAVGRANAAC
ncbi:hypothetical protein EJ06DRAFT_578829 [Trichodelitschia bisporula]|uniref:Uncharacterized protein n=1 Tax=Trichodelitschia bisporula TaxID=703511 RepID=A0A6G1I782_9PEZI|nr:hypothetical protein EJ06DRAFT_578829 [Trichodelitschia bisporula]